MAAGVAGDVFAGRDPLEGVLADAVVGGWNRGVVEVAGPVLRAAVHAVDAVPGSALDDAAKLAGNANPHPPNVAPSAVHGPPRPSSAAPLINPQQQAGHVAETPQYANRIKQGKPTSVFNASENADSVTLYAWEHGTPTANPNIRIFDYQRPIGTGFYGGNQTRVRVSINSRGEIHGSPWGPELP